MYDVTSKTVFICASIFLVDSSTVWGIFYLNWTSLKPISCLFKALHTPFIVITQGCFSTWSCLSICNHRKRQTLHYRTNQRAVGHWRAYFLIWIKLTLLGVLEAQWFFVSSYFPFLSSCLQSASTLLFRAAWYVGYQIIKNLKSPIIQIISW